MVSRPTFEEQDLVFAVSCWTKNARKPLRLFARKATEERAGQHRTFWTTSSQDFLPISCLSVTLFTQQMAPLRLEYVSDLVLSMCIAITSTHGFRKDWGAQLVSEQGEPLPSLPVFYQNSMLRRVICTRALSLGRPELSQWGVWRVTVAYAMSPWTEPGT